MEQEQTLEQLLSSNPDEAIKLLEADKKDATNIEEYIKEYEGERDIRETQVDTINKDKSVGSGANSKIVKSIRLPIQFQKKIVRVATAFEVGEPATLIPSNKENALHEEVKVVFKNNRIEAKIQELIKLKKTHTEGALLFAMKQINKEGLFNKLLGKLGVNQRHEIKCSVLSNKNGTMAPYFDSTGNMTFFTWFFETKIGDKDIKNYWVYNQTTVYKIDNTTGSFGLTSSDKHGFSKIPVVYVSQELPEWEDVKILIDRFEVSLSKLGNSNDYSGHPLLKIFGKVTNAPDKDEDGKAFLIPIDHDEEGKEIKGDVQFLTNDNAPDSVKLELEKLEDLIHSVSSTPNISFDNVKGISGISGIALKLMFLDAMIKAKSNEGDNRTMYERIISVIISGIITTVNTGLKNSASELYYDVVFNSILPGDLKEAVDIVKTAKEAGVMSQKTGIEYLNMTSDTDKELEQIKEEEASKTEVV